MITKKGLVVIFVLSLLLLSAQAAMAENNEYSSEGEAQTMEQTGENHMLQWRYRYRTKILEGVQNKSVTMECNISKKAGKLYINSYEYQKGMTVEVQEQSQNKLQIKVSAEFSEGKVLVLNIEESAFKVKNSQQLKVKFDGKEISEANIDEIIQGNTTQAKYATAIGDDGGQFLVYIPHFSEHLISFELINVPVTQTMDFIIGAIGIAILTLLILIVVVIKIGKFKND